MSKKGKDPADHGEEAASSDEALAASQAAELAVQQAELLEASRHEELPDQQKGKSKGKEPSSSSGRPTGVSADMLHPEILRYLKDNHLDLDQGSLQSIFYLTSKNGVPGDKKLKGILSEFSPRLPMQLENFILTRKGVLFTSIGPNAPLAAKLAHFCGSLGDSLQKLPTDVPDPQKLLSLSTSVDQLLGFPS